MFIAFEGRDGAGKSTGAKELAEKLSASTGRKVYLKHFPDYDSTIGGLIGEILSGKKEMPSFEALEMLYVADQLSFQKELEELLFDENAIVICDRYDLSTLAFYIAKTGCSMQDGIDLVFKKWQSELRKPDITFIYDFKGDLDERRGNEEKDKIESDDTITKNINKTYLALANHFRYDSDRHSFIISSELDIESNVNYMHSIVETELIFVVKYMLGKRDFKNKKIKAF